ATLEEVRAEVAVQATISYFPDRVIYSSAAELVSDASRIVIATYLGCTARDESETSAATGLLTGDTRTDAIQRFEVVETLKGSISPGQIQEVVSTSVVHRVALEGRRPAHVMAFDVLYPEKDEQYVLFLRDYPDPQQ